MIDVTAEYNKIQDKLSKGGLTPKDRTAIPQMEMPHRDPKERARIMDEVTYGFSKEQAVVEANRCLQCKNPTCVEGCPVNVDIPGFIGQIAKGEFKAAINIIKRTSLLPAICGRVCSQEKQCQKTCMVGKSTRMQNAQFPLDVWNALLQTGNASTSLFLFQKLQKKQEKKLL